MSTLKDNKTKGFLGLRLLQTKLTQQMMRKFFALLNKINKKKKLKKSLKKNSLLVLVKI
jgi:hypothetical protein